MAGQARLGLVGWLGWLADWLDLWTLISYEKQ